MKPIGRIDVNTAVEFGQRVNDALDEYTELAIDFEEVEIIPYNEEEIETSYVNSNYDLLASTRHTFTKDGYRVAYSFNSAGLDVRVSKKTKDKLNMFS